MTYLNGYFLTWAKGKINNNVPSLTTKPNQTNTTKTKKACSKKNSALAITITRMPMLL